jgi:hypothetical protein
MADEDEDTVCGHSLCSCVITADSEYCSLYCEEADEADVGGIACECGHPGCAGEFH